MNLPGVFLGRQCIAGFAVTEMIVVRPKHDPRLQPGTGRNGCGKVGHDVLSGLRCPLNGGLDRDLQRRNREPGGVRIAGVERLLRGFERLVGYGGENLTCHRAADACRDDPRSGERRIEAHGNRLAGIRRARTGHDEHRFGAALPGGHRLVTEIRVARENLPCLLIGVFGKVPEDQDDLVLDVQRGVAVVPEVLAVGHDDAVAGEDHVARHVAIIRERERANIGFRTERAIANRHP